MRDWLTVIIVILILGIILDGIRRMRQAKRESLTLSRNAKKADREPVSPETLSEFPSGGARVVGNRESEEAKSLNENVRKSFEEGRVTVGAPQRIPEQVALNLEASVPMLMESVEVDSAEDSTEYSSEESADAQLDAQSESGSSQENYSDSYAGHAEPELGSLEVEEEPEISDAGRGGATQSVSARQEPEHSGSLFDSDKATVEQGSDGEDVPEMVDPDEVLIMNVMAKSGTRFAGQDLLNALMKEGLKLGAMDIFHRHLGNDGDAPVVYSLANIVVPGTFNLAQMAEFQTPGVSLFLSLPVAGDSLQAYDDLAKTARNIADSLDGELKDENRSAMTGQTIEHGRQRVVEYERKKKLAEAGVH